MSHVQFVRKVPVTVEAFLWNGPGDFDSLCAAYGAERFDLDGINVLVKTPEGTLIGRPGDRIIRGVKGEVYPIMPSAFEATYEVVS